MTDDKLRAALDMLDRHSAFDQDDGNYRVEAGTWQAVRAALAASATDEGRNPAECAICGDYVAGGQPVHNICVAELTAKAEDRSAVPEALDVEREVDNAIYTVWYRVSALRLTGDWTARKRQVLDIIDEERAKHRREYAALRSKEPTDDELRVALDDDLNVRTRRGDRR